jgi:hypothetical protein
MLENSLKTREKYINKLKGKLDSMIESVSLLQKVDKKLLKVGVQNGGARLNNLRIAPMRGGADPKNYNFADVETAALRKKAQILLQQKNISDLKDKLQALTNDFKPVQIALENVKQLIDSIKVDFPKDILDNVVPNFSELPLVWQYNALHNIKFDNLYSFKVGAKDLSVDGNMSAFDIAPTEQSTAITQDEKNEMLAYANKINTTPNATIDMDTVRTLYDLTRVDIHGADPVAPLSISAPGPSAAPSVASSAASTPAASSQPVVPGTPGASGQPGGPAAPTVQKYRFY